MIADIVTIAWKEYKDFLLQRGGRGMLTSLALMVVVFGVFLPLQSGRSWVESPVSLVSWVWLPLFLVTGMIADSFAGERERHTLETLLASRLSDRAILLGKMAAAIGYALGMTVLFLIVGLITVNVTNWDGQLLLYPAASLMAMLGFGGLAAVLVAGLGVLVSLRAATVRQAAQSLSVGILILVWVPFMIMLFLPRDVQQRLLAILQTLDTRLIVAVLLVALLVLDTVVVGLAMVRFQRTRLILD